MEWFTQCYRATLKSKTIAEKWLTDPDIPLPAAQLIEARLDAKPSFYRIEVMDIESGEVHFENLLEGPNYTVTDFSLAETAESRIVLPARVFPAGDFYFFAAAGPPLTEWQMNKVIDYFDYQNIELTPDKLHQHPYVLGWLWEFYESNLARPTMPKINNTDGDPMLLHTATYKVEDIPAARKELKSMPSIDFHKGENDYIWFREGFGNTGIEGQRTLLGRLKFVKNELIVETNSKKRHELSRKWLEKIPGITFVDVSTQELDLDSLPIKDPTEHERPHVQKLSKEEKQSLIATTQNFYRSWLDTSIPMLDGLTPRQAAKKAKYRNKVAAMIRAMPKPTGNIPDMPDVPRKEMLKELGLQ
jgi:hypothetical protein